jgi:hypothetical protein
MFAADAAKGDVTYVIQAERILGLGSQYYGTVSGPALVLNSLTINNGGTTTFAGALAAMNPQSIGLNIKGSQWATKFQNVGPSAAVGDYFWTVVIRNPFLTDRNLVGPYYFFNLVGPGTNPLMEWEGNGGLVDTNVGSATFTDPFPSAWPLVSMADYESYVSIPMPGGQSIDFTILNWYGAPGLPSGGFAPLMSPVQNPLINGASLFTAATSNTTAVTLSWSAPTDLTAYGYCVTALQYDPATASLNGREFRCGQRQRQ